MSNRDDNYRPARDRGRFSFEEAVWRELDQIRETNQRQADALEKTLTKFEERDEERDKEISELRLQVNLLRGECRRNLKRDAGLVLAPTTLTAIVTAIINALQPAPPPPPVPQSPAMVAPAHPVGG